MHRGYCIVVYDRGRERDREQFELRRELITATFLCASGWVGEYRPSIDGGACVNYIISISGVEGSPAWWSGLQGGVGRGGMDIECDTFAWERDRSLLV